MYVLISLWELILNIAAILRNKKANRTQLLLTYLKMRFKYIFFIKFFKHTLHQDKILGSTIEFFNYSHVIALFEEIFIGRGYEFESHSESPFIIDCGSNIGMSILFFKKLYPRSKIIAFEPDKATFEILRRNVLANNLTDVALNNKAVYNTAGTINFYYDDQHPGSLNMSTIQERVKKDHENVDSILLSSFIERPVDFLKMDIEGAENLVIEELSKHNKLKLVKEMCIEYHHHIKPTEDKLSQILKILEENNFGYQISIPFIPPFSKEIFQDILIYAYTKN